jgi:hypothetical protein
MTVMNIKGYALVSVMFSILIISVSMIIIHQSDDVFLEMAINRIEALK